jgi:mannose-6-phosphate isomerase-like protein (cupin superfamily)
MTQTQEQLEAGYWLSKNSGVIDVWWPYQPRVGRYTVKIGSEQTEGRLSQLLCRDRRGGAPPLHIHHREDETFYVIAGEISFFVGDQRIEATAGDFVFAPKNGTRLPRHLRRRRVPRQLLPRRGGAVLRRDRPPGRARQAGASPE